MAKRFGSQTRPWIYRFLVERDGELCALCHHPAAKSRKLQIHHKDNNPENDSANNLFLLCGRCNRALQTLSVKRRIALLEGMGLCVCMCVCENERVNNPTTQVKRMVDYSKGPPEMSANAKFEIPFLDWLNGELRKFGSYPKKEAINSGAYATGASTATISRYLVKLTSLAGPLEESPDGRGETMLTSKNGHQDAVTIEGILKEAAIIKAKAKTGGPK